MKIVYNACYGGFSVSEAAMLRYAQLRGVKVYPEKGKYGLVTYWTTPKEEIKGLLKEEDFYSATQEARVFSNKVSSENQICTRQFVRHDPILVQVVEELGDKASGDCAKLSLFETDSRMYRIDEYDGYESVATSYADDGWVIV